MFESQPGDNNWTKFQDRFPTRESKNSIRQIVANSWERLVHGLIVDDAQLFDYANKSRAYDTIGATINAVINTAAI